MELVDEFLRLNLESRLLAAEATLAKITTYLSACSDASETASIQSRLATLSPIIDQLHHRLIETRAALEASASTEELDDSWTLGMSYLGITTHYKAADNGCITVRLAGVLEDFPLFEQAAVIHELDLFKDWMPFCNNSKTIAKLGPAELVGYIGVYIPPMSRDTVIRAFACDCLFEQGKIVLSGKSEPQWPPKDSSQVTASAMIQQLANAANQRGMTAASSGKAALSPSSSSSSSASAVAPPPPPPSSSSSAAATTASSIPPPPSVYISDIPPQQEYDPEVEMKAARDFGFADLLDDVVASSAASSDDVAGHQVPWVTPGWFHDKMDIQDFCAVVELVSPSSAKTIFVMTVDPRANLPKSFVNFIIKNLAGVMLYLFQQKVQKVARDPSCPHGDRIRSNLPFYRDWLLPKLRAFCDFKSWPQPTIATLGADGLVPEPQRCAPLAL